MTNAYDKLKQMRIDDHTAKHGEPPHRYFDSEFSIKKPTKASQLEALICEYIERSGGVCTKVYTGGRSIVTQTNTKDVTGKHRTITDQKWVPGTTESGTSDLIASIPGVKGAVYIEVKMPGDKMRDTQVRFQQKVVARGFKYVVVRSLSDVVELI